MLRIPGSVVASMLLVALGAAVATAEDDLKATTEQVKEAIGKGDTAAAKAAFEKAIQLKAGNDAKKLAPLVKEIGKGVTHKDAALATSAAVTLGTLGVPGSSKSLAPLLNPPPKPASDRLTVHLAGIKSAGEIHDPETLKALEKLLDHPHGDIAAAGAEAFGGYKDIEEKQRMALLKKLVGSLAKIEKRCEKAKDEEERAAAEKVRDALTAAMNALSRTEGAKTADEWEEWIKEQAKAGKS